MAEAVLTARKVQETSMFLREGEEGKHRKVS